MPQLNSIDTSIPEEALRTQKALLERPSFSIRFRITSAFALAMFFSFGIGIVSMVFISQMDAKQGFFEQAENFSLEVQEARRYEKNYFLYGAKSDLYEALNHTHAARATLEESSDIRSSLEREAYADLSTVLTNYESLLNQLSAQAFRPDNSANPRDPGIEGQLRHFGHQILTYAADMVKRERTNMHSTASSLRVVAISALLINLIVIGWVTVELTRQILRPLGRTVQYTQRIAEGDFSLITPKRKFRDEFSNLVIAINRMILELRRNQEQLLQSRKMAAVGTLTSGIAHELNNPLNNISITTEALLECYDDFDKDQLLKMLGDIFTQTERASATVRNLLDFTRDDHAQLESVEVPDLVRASLNLVANELSLNNIKTDTEFEAHLPRIRGYFRNLQQVFLNLFLNAVQAMPEGGRLSIRALVDLGKHVRVDVCDTGCGIPEENIDRIFEPFFTTKQVGQGTGLGLSVSYGIIQAVGGHIAVESEQGKGTTFSVYLVVDKDTG
jgi:signal transduction histidine kinase